MCGAMLTTKPQTNREILKQYCVRTVLQHQIILNLIFCFSVNCCQLYTYGNYFNTNVLGVTNFNTNVTTLGVLISLALNNLLLSSNT